MQKEDPGRINILDIPIDKINFFGALRKVEELINSRGNHQVATVNPEFIMHSLKNQDFRSALQESSLNTADGIGIIWASKFLGIKTRNAFSRAFWLKLTLLAIVFNHKWLSSEIPERVTGVELMWELANRAQERGWRLFLLNWKSGRSKVEDVAEKLKTLYPRLNIVGMTNSGPDDKDVVEQVAKTKPDILFVAFGSPKQEIFIHKNLDKLGSKVAIGVGGSFDFVVGKAKRAPKIFQKLGIEWVWRWLMWPTPKRASRLFNAFPRFVWAVWKGK